jgi:hypothetical protein
MPHERNKVGLSIDQTRPLHPSRSPEHWELLSVTGSRKITIKLTQNLPGLVLAQRSDRRNGYPLRQLKKLVRYIRLRDEYEHTLSKLAMYGD